MHLWVRKLTHGRDFSFRLVFSFNFPVTAWSVGLLLFVKGLSEPNSVVSSHTLSDMEMRLTKRPLTPLQPEGLESHL